MTNRNLEVFVAVARCGKMSQAAKELFITQSSVSQAISEIEKEYGVLLFERLSKSLYLTDIGRGLLDYASKAISLHTEMDDYLRSASRESKLRIGATVTIGTCLIGPIIGRMEEIMPGVRCEVTVANTQDVESLLLKSSLDIGLVEGMIASPDLTVSRAMDDDMALICGRGHPFYGRERVDVSELAGQPFIMRERGSGTRDQLERVLRDNRVTVDEVWDCCNSQALINGVIGGCGVSVISKRLVSEQAADGRLWVCGIEGAELGRTFDLVYHKDKLISPAMKAFIGVCRDFGAGNEEEN